ncbi:FxsA family protein [Curvivirga aplysinae]|uniref:FxsA family protein n=1 Tax=Curvivirga aplysinae TaxID=2529852 RepID=UPI0012BC9ED2|nr:FxsA family protein [Curvivirga aplysinae]MTI09084.1 FxsA family protein [Curvivirga aplysinae]
MPLLLLFIIIPVIEIFLFIEIGDKIGVVWTIITVLATAFIGTALVRKQGFDALTKAQSNLDQNKLPMEEVFTGICLLVAGALLLTPGFLTDAIGFTLLIPLFRKSLGATIWGWIKKNGHIRMRQNQFGQNTNFNQGAPFNQTYNRDDIIDGEFEEVHPRKDPISPSKQINTDADKQP